MSIQNSNSIETSKSFNEASNIEFESLDELEIEINLDFAEEAVNKGAIPSLDELTDDLFASLTTHQPLEDLEFGFEFSTTDMSMLVGADEFSDEVVPQDDELSDETKRQLAVKSFINTNTDTLNYLTNSVRSTESMAVSKVEKAFGRDKIISYMDEQISMLYMEGLLNPKMTDVQLITVIRKNINSEFLQEYDVYKSRTLSTQKKISNELDNVRRLLTELKAFNSNKLESANLEVNKIASRLDDLLSGVNYDCSDLSEATCTSLIESIKVENTINERSFGLSSRVIEVTCSNGHCFSISSLGRLGPGNKLILNLFECPECGGYCILPAGALDDLKANIESVDITHKSTDTNANRAAYRREIPTAYYPLLSREVNNVINQIDEAYVERESKVYLDKLRDVVSRKEISSNEQWLHTSIVSYLAEISNTTIEELRLIGKSAIYNSHFFRVYVNKGSTLPNILRNILSKLDNNEPLMFAQDKSDFLEIVTMLSGIRTNPTTFLNKTKAGYNFSATKIRKYLENNVEDSPNSFDFPDGYLEEQCREFFLHNVYYDIENVKFNPFLLYKTIPNIDDIVDKHLLFIVSAVSDSVYKVFYPSYTKLGKVTDKLFTGADSSGSVDSSSDDPIVYRLLQYDGKLLLFNSDVYGLYNLLTSGSSFTIDELIHYRDLFGVTVLGPMLSALTDGNCISSTIKNGWAMTCLTNTCYALLQSMFSKVIILDELLLNSARIGRSVVSNRLLNSLTSVKLVKSYPTPDKYESNLLPYMVFYMEEVEIPLELELARYAIGFKAEKTTTTSDGAPDYTIGIDVPLEMCDSFENEWMQAFVNASDDLRSMLISAGIDYSLQLETMRGEMK